LDNDGDLDIYGVAWTNGNEVAWWENTVGDGSAWQKHSVQENYLAGLAGLFADLDGDGDDDLISSAQTANTVSWWENCGGQFSLLVTDSSPTTMDPSDIDDLLRVTAVHTGRTGDHDVELVNFDILLEEQDGDPLTTLEANALIENLSIYLDDGSGIFEVGSDTLVTTISDLNLTGGVQTVGFTDGDGNVQVSFNDGSRVYFVVVEITADPANDPNWNNIETVQATLLHETSTAEDSDYDIPLTQDCQEDVTGGITVDIPDPTPTPTPTNTPPLTPSSTSTPRPTSTPTVSPTPSSTPTVSPTPTSTSTPTPTSTPTITPTPTNRPTPSSTPTITPTPTSSSTPTPSSTPTNTPTPTFTPTPSPTSVPTSTPTLTPTPPTSTYYNYIPILYQYPLI
jgi:hypothetical protein